MNLGISVRILITFVKLQHFLLPYLQHSSGDAMGGATSSFAGDYSTALFLDNTQTPESTCRV